jgi:V-type H+-transporting ATPase subunit G
MREQHKSQTTTSQSSIDSDTQKQLEQIKANVSKHQKDVVAKIVERVLKCEPDLHRNLKKVEA